MTLLLSASGSLGWWRANEPGDWPAIVQQDELTVCDAVTASGFERSRQPLLELHSLRTRHPRHSDSAEAQDTPVERVRPEVPVASGETRNAGGIGFEPDGSAPAAGAHRRNRSVELVQLPVAARDRCSKRGGRKLSVLRLCTSSQRENCKPPRAGCMQHEEEGHRYIRW